MLEAPSSPARPREVTSIEDTGLPFGMLLDLILKQAYFEGTPTLQLLCERSKLSMHIVHTLFRHLQKEQLIEVRSLPSGDYEFSLTSRGRGMADVALQKGHYAGAAPVALADYQRVVSSQGLSFRPSVTGLKTALEDLVLDDRVIKQLGTALATGGSILLYGDTGNGKTSIAERLPKVFDDVVYVPFAVEIAGNIITVFDPQSHQALAPAEMDPRWMLCRRPLVKVGGEMTADMLEARVDPAARVGIAPIQMKANNGILLIDDFGRQRISPRELLNRWIVPLDRRRDLLSLSGTSFEIPFEVLVIFATNLSVSDLAEDAFLRRLKNKIKVEPMSPDLFRELIRRACRRKKLPLAYDVEDYFLDAVGRRSRGQLRACYPGDLVDIVCGRAAFEEHPPRLGSEDVDYALDIYFTH